ncbi:hypothetical protein [Shewanella algae]|uniref:hypothetical protein n=1 Tax=Shewanella algae TaxID=38313 RepID=UPI0031F58D03
MIDSTQVEVEMDTTKTKPSDRTSKTSGGVAVDRDYQTQIFHMMVNAQKSESELMEKWFTDQRRSALRMLKDFDKGYNHR